MNVLFENNFFALVEIVIGLYDRNKKIMLIQVVQFI